jgi:hypothetical protein
MIGYELTQIAYVLGILVLGLGTYWAFGRAH